MIDRKEELVDAIFFASTNLVTRTRTSQSKKEASITKEQLLKLSKAVLMLKETFTLPDVVSWSGEQCKKCQCSTCKIIGNCLPCNICYGIIEEDCEKYPWQKEK